MKPLLYINSLSGTSLRIFILTAFLYAIVENGLSQIPKPVNNDKEKVQAASKTALQKAEEGDVKQSIQILTALLPELSKGKESNDHRAYLHFNLGYVYNHYGSVEYEDYLSKSIHHYRQSLAFQPGDLKTLNNLSLLLHEDEKYDSTILLLNEMIRLDPGQKGVYLTTIGDVYRSAGQFEKARKYYQSALESKDPQSSAGLKLIDLYTEYPFVSGEQWFNQCKQFETEGYLELAKPCYEALLSKSNGSQFDSKLLDESVLKWMASSIILEYVSPDLLFKTGLDTVALQAISELNTQLKIWNSRNYRITDSEHLKWWKAGVRPKFYFLAFEKSYADYLMNNADAKYAIPLYEQVLDQLWYSQDFSGEIYGRENALITDLVIMMARIYNNPKYKDENKWKDLENHILDEKASAYRTNNLANREKFHTILGQIYLERGEYTGHGYKNAQFQLENAINVSKRRAEADPSAYHPVPNLYLLLGMLHDTLKNEKEAYDAYVNAALGYLESDNMRHSGEMIKKASVRDTANQNNDVKLSAVKSIYHTRVMIPKLEKEDFDSHQNTFYQKDSTFAWFSDKRIKEIISPEILERQRFKILSDLSIRAAKVDATESSEKLSDDARNTAKNVKVMTTSQDNIRIRDLEIKSNYVPEQNLKVNRDSGDSFKKANETTEHKLKEYSKDTRKKAGGN